MSNDAYAEKPYARLWLRGFQSFHNPAIQIKLGQLSVFGDHKNVTKDSVSGNITIEADTVNVVGDWFSKADDFLTFLMCGLGFVHGGRLQTPRLDQVSGCEWIATFYSGAGFQHDLPAVHKMMHGEYIKALAARYDSELGFPDMLWTVTGWLHAGSTIGEVKFLR